MAAKYSLMPNESVILQESSVAHGGVMAGFTDDLMLTNLNIVCINKGILGNTKNIFQYPLSQIKRYNGKPQAVLGKLSNGTATLDIFFVDGRKESFYFNSLGNKRKINQWINEIINVVCGDDPLKESEGKASYIEPDSVAGAVLDAANQVKDMGAELLGSLGIKPGFLKSVTGASSEPERVSRKCSSCSAPLVGFKGKAVKCKYCDTVQTL